MKKIYLLLFTICLSFISFSQSTLVTIDRENILGPTATGNVATVSSIGLTRGTGINLSSGTDFSSDYWNATSQATAVSNNDYMEWSSTAITNFNIEITELDIRLRRDIDGPSNWQLFYSTDNFTTPGIAVNGVETLVEDVNEIYTYNSLSINSGTSGTITFRLYAWNATTDDGWLRVRRRAAWSDLGIDLPGIRITGNTTSTSTNSDESTIVATNFNPTDNFNYLPYNTPSGLTTTNSLKIGEFSIRDGGADLTDADLLPTILTGISFNVAGASNIAGLALFNGTTNVSEVTAVTSNTTFTNINSGLGITAPDNGSKTFSVYATFKNVVTDNEQLQLTISSAVPNGIAGSTFASVNAGGASTPIVGNDNRIEVTRSKLIFSQQPTDVSVFEIMTPAPTVSAVDVNNNLDLDFTGSILIGSAITLDGTATNVVAASAGVAVYDNLIFSEQGTDVLIATPFASGIAFGTSSSFTVLGPLLILAQQDFDGSLPEWTYTSNVPFFDNGWDTDGYYGIINSNIAAPLDNPSFSENILGSHDLNDEGNGTTGFATLTFSTIDISSYSNINLSFDYEVTGYTNDEAQYEVFYDGISQGIVDLVNGNNNAEGAVSIAIPDAVNSISLQVSISNNGNAAYTGFDNFLLTTAFDGLVYYSDIWAPNAPTNGTGGLNALVLDGTYTLENGDVSINNLIVHGNANMIIVKNSSLQVNGNLLCNDNVLLDSDSTEYSSLIVEGQVQGNIIYSRHINTNALVGGNDLISSPVISAENFGEFAANNPNIFSYPTTPTTEKLFGPYDKTTGLYLTYDTILNATASLDSGVGYRAASTDDLNFNFNGSVLTSDISVPIVVSGPYSPEWNLVGNPYPSYIKLQDFLAANNSQFTTVNSGVYGYDGLASDGWVIWNQAYSDANPDAVITPGQGFLVTSATVSGNISFTASMRSTGTSDDFIPGRVQNNNISHLGLKLENSDNKQYKTDFYFTDNATLGLDPGYDSGLYSGSAPALSIYSELVENNTGVKLGIQSVGTFNLENISIPLGVRATQGQQITISIDASTLSESTEVFLEDHVANTVTELTSSNFTLTPTTTINGIGRFFLRFGESTLTTEELDFNSLHVFATSTPKAIFIKGNLTETTLVKVIDMQGRLVLSSTLETGSSSNQIDVSNLATGIYAVSVSNKSLTKTQKVIIK